MNRRLKILLAFIGILLVYIAFMNFPLLSAYFDESKYVDGEVFTPVKGEYDFRKFTLNSSHTNNYTTTVCCSGYAQLLDDEGDHTINVLEWDKMGYLMRYMENSSLQKEFKRPSHVVDNITIIDVDFLSAKLYAAHIEDENSNTQIYIATPSEEDTVEMVETLRFGGSA